MSPEPAKMVNIQRTINIPLKYTYFAINEDGTMVGFYNAPVRDYAKRVWIDCTDGSFGEMINYEPWDISVRRVADLADMKELLAGRVKQREARENAQAYREELKKARERGETLTPEFINAKLGRKRGRA